MLKRDRERQECEERRERERRTYEEKKKKELERREYEEKREEERQRKEDFWRRSAMEFQANLLQSLKKFINQDCLVFHCVLTFSSCVR